MSDNNDTSFFNDLEERWCTALRIFNPYIDPFDNHLHGDIAVYDSVCYEEYPEHNFVYDKLWIAEDQGLQAGTVRDLHREDAAPMPSLPLFVKPRWGHKTSGSKHCSKVESMADLPSESSASEHDLMWSSFIDGTEGMTDFVMSRGRIVYQMTHTYSEEQTSFTEVWKFTSPQNKPPPAIESWVSKTLGDFDGVVNVQYRGDVIIEVGLRPARGGAYFVATDNKPLLDNVSAVLANEEWRFVDERTLAYKPFYSFKCHTNAPIVYTWPQPVLDAIMMNLTDRPFYEYYPEPTGKKGMVFFQFMHDDLEKGKSACRLIEELFHYTQYAVIAMWAVVLVFLVADLPMKWAVALLAACAFATQLYNPLSTHPRFCKARLAQIQT